MHGVKNIQFKGYKVFSSEQYIQVDNISSVNVIIGKNNSGKTSLLDVIETVFDSKSSFKLGRDIENIQFTIPFYSEMVDSVFAGYSGIGSWNKQKLSDHVRDKLYWVDLIANNKPEICENDFGNLKGHVSRANRIVSNKRDLYCFRKITAERNVCPELESTLKLDSNGDGASNLIATFLNNSEYDETIIEKDFLEALNFIMMPESEFESIRVQQVINGGQSLWEVFLQEKGQKRIPLSKTGSGLKTVVLVLLNFLVVPHLKEYKGKKIVYGFEELENNLHPALQRRLFEYIYNYSIEQNSIIFLTTHSHVAINAFYEKNDASIFHVIKENGTAYVKQIESYIDKTEILNDLDVKASDILQANGIIWVEGPSDRIYIKRWLELFTPNEFEEGKHYQFLYYGGRLLSQYSAKEETELINIITTNRNAAVVIDSDKRYRSAQLNSTKKRIIAEFEALNMFHWVTKGKEIENYLPKEAVEKRFDVCIKKECGQYQLFPDYIKNYYKNFSSKKVPFANEIKEYITKENSIKILDLKTQIDHLYKQIKKWNQ